ncbi:MAG: TolC family protein [Saprospirales bacterium]|jgi:outer membrane protein|nr:TolC family protein [Saprospirales bacterium]MBK8920461.1 TolC family protein [Saprospirales bacterium]
MHRIFLHSLSLICLLVFGQSATVIGQTAMRLADCVQYALDNHPQVQIAKLQIADADCQIKENTAIGLPQISAGIDYQYFIKRPGIPASVFQFGSSGPGADSLDDVRIVFSSKHSLSPSITLQQLLFSNSYLTGLKAARHYRQFVQLQQAVTQKTLRDQVTDAYLPALLIAENLLILDKNIANLEKLLQETQATNQAGFAEQLDVDRLQLALSSLRTERENLARQRDIVVNILKMAMGMPVKQELSLSDDLGALMAQYADADLTAGLNYMNRPEYVALLKGRELRLLQADLYRKPWMPTVAGFVQYQPGWQGGFAEGNKWFFIPSAIAGISVQIPIWDGGANAARHERAIIAAQAIDAQQQLLENAFDLEIETARKQYLNASERVGSQQQNLELAQRIYNTTQTKYKAGVGSSFELVSAEQQLYAAQQALMNAQFDLLTAKVTIRKALGATK